VTASTENCTTGGVRRTVAAENQTNNNNNNDNDNDNNNNNNNNNRALIYRLYFDNSFVW